MERQESGKDNGKDIEKQIQRQKGRQKQIRNPVVIQNSLKRLHGIDTSQLWVTVNGISRTGGALFVYRKVRILRCNNLLASCKMASISPSWEMIFLTASFKMVLAILSTGEAAYGLMSLTIEV